jgi:hypothetical protein
MRFVASKASKAVDRTVGEPHGPIMKHTCPEAPSEKVLTNDQGVRLLGFRGSTNYKGGVVPGDGSSVLGVRSRKGDAMKRHVRLYGLAVSAVGLASLYIVPVASAHMAWA